jgi:hypothetical protein
MITASTFIPGILAMLAYQAPLFHTTVEMVLWSIDGDKVIIKTANTITLLMQRIGSNLRKHLFTSYILMGRKPPFKILGSSDSIVNQKKLIFLLVKAIISPEKNPRKLVSILREKIEDFKLSKHIQLPVTHGIVESLTAARILKH